MKFFKKLAPAVALALCFGIGGWGDTSFSGKLGYNDGTLPNEDGTLFYREYDESLFYRNDLTPLGPRIHLRLVPGGGERAVFYIGERKASVQGERKRAGNRGVAVGRRRALGFLRGSVRAGNRLLGLFQPLGARSDLRRRGQILYDLFGA